MMIVDTSLEKREQDGNPVRVALMGVDCAEPYTTPPNCPRDAYPSWREIWLKRVSQRTSSPVEPKVVVYRGEKQGGIL
jgi:hypothetical protein